MTLAWELRETLPSSYLRNEVVTQLCAILREWATNHRPHALVTRSLAVRWDRERPAIGVDPDVAVFAQRPPGDLNLLRSMCTWEEGHSPPMFAIEVVSDADPHKDYAIAADKYAASGTQELVIFDPLLSGPTRLDGPFRLQVWRRERRTRSTSGGRRSGSAFVAHGRGSGEEAHRRDLRSARRGAAGRLTEN